MLEIGERQLNDWRLHRLPDVLPFYQPGVLLNTPILSLAATSSLPTTWSIHLSKTSAPNHCFITSSYSTHCSSSPIFSAILLRTSNLHQTWYSKRYYFSPSMTLPFNFCTDITVWACLFFLHSRSSSSFLCFSLSELLAWVEVFLGFLSPFLP